MMAAATVLPPRALPLVILALLGAAWHGSCAHDADRPAQQLLKRGGRLPGGGDSPLPATAPLPDRRKAGAAPSLEDQPPDGEQRPRAGGDAAALSKAGTAEPRACAGVAGGDGVMCSCNTAGEEGLCAGLGSATAPKAPEGMSATGGAKREVAKRGPAATCQLIGAGCPGAAAMPPPNDADSPSDRAGGSRDENSNRSALGQGQTPITR